MPDIIFTINISSDRAAEYLNYYLYKYPNNEMIPDPNWVDPEDGSKAPLVKKYTNKEKINQDVIEFLKNRIKKGKDAYNNANSNITGISSGS
ncbi:MAG: hypothetical protein ACW98D_20790 [Promethearchaeota archaeon]